MRNKKTEYNRVQ